MKKVACVGIMVADVIVEPVKGFPERGLLMPVNSITMHNGGNAMTAAINLQKLGVESTLVGKVGNDVFGDFLIKRLREENVNPDGIKIDSNVQTSTSVLMIEEGTGERSFFHCVGSNGAFVIDDIDFNVIEKNDIVFVTGTYLLKQFDGQQTVEFLKKCKEMGKITALDVCWDASGRWGELINDAMPYIDIFLPSIDEAKMIARSDDLDKMADFFFEKGIGSLVIKCGSKGCYCCESKTSEAIMLPCYKVENAVDTTGAGDSFCSGFLSALARGKDFLTCAKIGNAVGAHCVMAKGATSGIKPYNEIIKFMIERGENNVS